MNNQPSQHGQSGGDDHDPSTARRTPKRPRHRGAVPAGVYDAAILDGYLVNICYPFNTRAPYYYAVFRVTEGPYAGARFSLSIYWRTEPERQDALRQLRKLGITNFDQLKGMPPNRGLRCRAGLTLHERSGGKPYNRVEWFEVFPIFAPGDSLWGEGGEE